MDSKYIIAFDQGTTSTRSILFNQKGIIVAIAQKELKQHYPQSGWVEHDAMEIYEAQKSTFEEVLQKTEISIEEISGIGITNQRETTVVWNKKTGKPIYKAIVWLDNRTKNYCESLKKDGLEKYVNENTGLVIDSYFSATKLHWILNNLKGAQEKAEAGELLFGTIDSWLIYKFTKGKSHVTDITNASRTMLYNCKELCWDEKLLDTFNIPKSMLPQVQESSSYFGDILYGITKIPIYGVAGDQQASLFGHCGTVSGIAKNTFGTGCFMLLHTGSKFITSKNGLLTTIACSLPDQKVQYALEGSIFIGGASIQWLRDQLKIIKTAKETEAICESIPPLEDIYFVPAFAGLGAPYWDAGAKGALYGLTLDTGRNEITKATVEALAFQTKDVLMAMQEDCKMKMKKLQVDGGASENNYLMQFQADMLDVPVEKPEMIEVSALGVAFLAGLKAGIWKKNDLEILRKTEKVYLPKIASKIREQKYKGWKQAVKRTQTN